MTHGQEKGQVIGALKENIQSVLNENTDVRLVEVEKVLKEKQTELSSVENDVAKTDEIGDAILSLRE